MPISLARKLEILADAAKYDASYASSGALSRQAGRDGIGSTQRMGSATATRPTVAASRC